MSDHWKLTRAIDLILLSDHCTRQAVTNGLVVLHKKKAFQAKILHAIYAESASPHSVSLDLPYSDMKIRIHSR